jgi:hypothetical protein
MENHSGMTSTGENTDSFTRAPWKYYKQSSETEELAKEMMNFAL